MTCSRPDSGLHHAGRSVTKRYGNLGPGHTDVPGSSHPYTRVGSGRSAVSEANELVLPARSGNSIGWSQYLVNAALSHSRSSARAAATDNITLELWSFLGP
jgi:hypothetical protein